MIEFETYCPTKHLDQVVELEKKLWAGKSTVEIKKIFEWKYPEKSHFANGFVALDEERVVGFRGFFIQNYVDDGQVVPVAVLGDAVVHPDYQRRGIFANLTKKAMEYYRTSPMNYVLALSSNAKSSPGYLKLGWLPFLRKEYRIRFSIINMMSGFLKRQSKTAWGEYDIYITGLSGINVLAQELDVFCRLIDGKQGISLRRDSHYWTWRFANPDWQAAFAVMRMNGEIKGVIAYLPEKRKGIDVIRILDVAINDFSLLPILFKGLRRMTKAWCYFILAASGMPDDLLKSCFPLIRRNNSNTPADFYLIKSLSDDNERAVETGRRFIINYANID